MLDSKSLLNSCGNVLASNIVLDHTTPTIALERQHDGPTASRVRLSLIHSVQLLWYPW